MHVFTLSWLMGLFLWFCGCPDRRVRWGCRRCAEDPTTQSTPRWEHLRVCGTQQWRRGVCHCKAGHYQRWGTLPSPHAHILSPSFSTWLVLSFHVHTPEFNRHFGFPGLSVVDVTIEPHPASHCRLQSAVLFIVPLLCDRAWFGHRQGQLAC